MTDRSRRQRRAGRGALTLHLLTIALVLLPRPAVPATITVDGQTSDPPGTCDLVEAIENAENDSATNADCDAGAGDDEIVLTLDVVLTASEDGNPDGGTGLPRINGDNGKITIQGGDFTISRDAGATDKFRIFAISQNGDLTLNDVTLTGGLVNDPGKDSVGGAITVNRGVVTLTNSTISGNTVSGNGDHPYAYGGGIYNLGGTVSITDNTIANNRAEVLNQTPSTTPSTTAAGGGISNCSLFCGDTTSTLTITSSTISGNTAEVVADTFYQPSSYGGGLYGAYGDINITNSTISGNTATVTGGFLQAAQGGGIMAAEADVVLQSSTISSNTVSSPGTPGAAGLDFLSFYGSAKLYDSAFGNHPGLANCYGITIVEDQGGNLADDASCGPIPSTLTNLDAVLADNGGPTETHALFALSTAIDAAGDCGQAFDQRGVARPVGFCDTGAFERGPCQAADGDTFIVPDQVISTDVTFETCSSLTVADTDVVGSGHLTLRTGGRVVFENGFEVDGLDARLTVENDPGIVMPDDG